MGNTTIDMTTGRLLRRLRFWLPTLAGNLLHQAYSLIEGIIVGKYLDKTALAAVSCTMPIILLLASLMIGVNVAVSTHTTTAYLTIPEFWENEYTFAERIAVNK